jgi:hypothetical protein
MKNLYLLLTIIGFAIPNYFVLQEGLASGNWLLWLDPALTLSESFANLTSTVFISDLLWVVLVYVIWILVDAPKVGVKRPWVLIILTMLFGLAGTFPLYLYLRNQATSKE